LHNVDLAKNLPYNPNVRTKTFFSLLWIFILVALISCQSASINLEEYLIGLWQQDGSRVVCQFNGDGTFRCADKDLLEERPFDVGKYQLEGTVLTFISSEESRYCPGKSGAYELELTEEQRLLFTQINTDECSTRSRNMFSGGSRGGKSTDYPWSRISP
jgi:hypothetical protein